MRRTLLTVGGIRVPSYPAMLYLGTVLGIVAQNAAANSVGLPSARVYVATLVLFPVGLAGARLLHVAGRWPEYRHDLRRIMDRAEGGMAMYGGLLLMVPASVAVLAVLDVPYWRFWDVSSFLILLAMVFTRVGCLLNGCCAGRITTGRLGMRLADVTGTSARRVPTQLLEATLGAALLATALFAWPRLTNPGELFLLVVAGYAAGRLALQPLRAEHGRIDALSLLSGAFVALALVGLILLRT